MAAAAAAAVPAPLLMCAAVGADGAVGLYIVLFRSQLPASGSVQMAMAGMPSHFFNLGNGGSYISGWGSLQVDDGPGYASFPSSSSVH